MRALNPGLLFASTRLKMTLADAETGKECFTAGTGFWVKGRQNIVLVTNRHNLDPSLRFPNKPALRLVKLEAELRHHSSPNSASNLTQIFEVENVSDIRNHPDADCSILVAPRFKNHQTSYTTPAVAITFGDLVTAAEFSSMLVHPMETAFFIGYPGRAGLPWWDEYWQLAIARQCTVASHPALHFKNRDVKTTHVLLVSGMSFAGSSGSPVYVPHSGLKPGGDFVDPDYRPAKLIGIMSGHFEEPDSVPRMFQHTGLSYLTRSSAIVELLDAAGEGPGPPVA